MRLLIPRCALAAALLGLAACGGGNGYSAPAVTVTTPGPASATTLATAMLLGAPGFVAPSGYTAYVLSDDTTASLACTVANGCTAAWPPIAAPAGVALSTSFGEFMRPDTGAPQLTYLGHPLYNNAGDAAAQQTTGNAVASFGGTWSVARP